jgi:hypothetical protein
VRRGHLSGEFELALLWQGRGLIGAQPQTDRRLVHLDRNRYSVPASFANHPVSVRVCPERIGVVAEGQVVCEHRRVFARSHERKSTTTVFDWRRYLAVIQRKPGALA